MRHLNPKLRLKRVRPLLGTFVAIDLTAQATEGEIHSWISAGFDAIETVDRLMSVHRPDSDISRLNRASQDEKIPLHPWTAEVLEAARELQSASDGVFDIRCGGNIELGGIAKGYAVDRAVDVIRRAAGERILSGV